MASTIDSSAQPDSLDTVTAWARSNREWDKVCQYLAENPRDLFAVCPNRRWPIAHQIVYHNKIDVLEKVLASFTDYEIDLETKSGDNRTLLSVATEKQAAHPAMFQYVSSLYKHDEIISAAKKSDWPKVQTLLDSNKSLANEKPVYASCFLLHYIVKNGNAQVLQQFVNRFQFNITVLNNQNETPLQMASKLGKHDMCTILQKIPISHQTPTQPNPNPSPFPGVPPPSTPPTTQRPHGQPPTSSTYQAPPAKSTTPKTTSPSIGSAGFFSGIDEKSDGTAGQTTLTHSANPAKKQTTAPSSPAAQNPQTPTSTSSSDAKHTRAKKTIISEVLLTNDESELSSPLTISDKPESTPPSFFPPLPSPKTSSSLSAADILTFRLTCQLSKKLFVDPVIAEDGVTYERSAIIDWVNTHHTSPQTRRPMNPPFYDNRSIKALAQLLRPSK